MHPDMVYRVQKSVINWFGNIQIFKYPMFVVLGKTSYKIKGPHMRSILETRKPGDIFLRKYDNYLSSRIIPGYWSHAAIYVGQNQMIHMLSAGTVKEDILTFMRCDDIKIIRCSDTKMIKKARELAEKVYTQGVEYDYSFSASNDKFYCTELISHLFQKPTMTRKGETQILPDDLLTLPDHGPFKVVWEKT
ncbi:hypothetical protein KAR91_16095 [Candidatus Pacearchaeota archaeon]|nr:hypothetical protein [Candidatus Pacearchaeota archaeon]